MIEELGILTVLSRAHALAGLSGELPTQTFALTRLLLAVLHSAIDGPRDLDDWQRLWEAETLPVDQIENYLDRYRDRFYLFHPTTPFLQVPDLRTAKGETSELSKLVADVPNGEPFFTTRRADAITLSFAEAARWLVHIHAFDMSGIKSGAVGDPRVKSGKGYPIGVGWSGSLGGVLLEGRTFKETLLLNLVADTPEFRRDPETDRPVWERPQLTAAEEVPGGRTPTGPVDLYVWPSRRVRLVRTGDRVTSVLIANGDKLTPQNMHLYEPHTAWRRSQAQEKKAGASTPVYMPRKHEADRAIWRGLQSLLPAGDRQTGDAADSLAPGVVEWLGVLTYERIVDRDYPVRVRAIGMTYGQQESSVTDVIDDALALRAMLAQRDAGALVGIAVSGVEVAEAAVQAVGNLAGDLAAAAGGDGTGRRSRVMERAYARLDQPYRSWLLTLTPEAVELDLKAEWQRTVLEIVRDEGRELLEDIPPAAWEGRVVRGHVLTAAHAADRFDRAVREALPLAFAQHAGVPA